MPVAFTALICERNNVKMAVHEFIAVVHVLRQLRRGFCTIVLHLIYECVSKDLLSDDPQ